MQVKETQNEGLKRGYAITITADELDAKVSEKLTEAQPDVEMKGFRKGKVPLALLRKQFGQRLLGEAMQESIDGAVSSHLEETGDRPAAQPQIEDVQRRLERRRRRRGRSLLRKTARHPRDRFFQNRAGAYGREGR